MGVGLVMVYCLLKYNVLIESMKHIITVEQEIEINRVWTEWRQVKPLWRENIGINIALKSHNMPRKIKHLYFQTFIYKVAPQ